MSERDGYEHGVPCWVVGLAPDPDQAAAFYGGLFGWSFEPDEPVHVVARLRGRVVAGLAPLGPAGPEAAPGWVTQVQVQSADAVAEQAAALGGTVLAGPADFSPAGRATVLRDPTGAVVGAWEPARRRGAEVVNEPGAWSMSSLVTPDPQAAARFYGELFGWTTESFDLGEETMTMFRLPGYVGGEPQQPVSREVIATMSAMPAQQADAGVRPHWSAAFWVADAAGAAAQAAELGGTVVAEPFDIGIGWSAVLADPAGGVFSVSQVGPPR